MDHRYFWGIRDLAAQVIAASAKAELEWIGFFHLKKAFQELFCLPGSSMTRPNDFSDRTSYIIQCAIPKAIAKIKDKDGKSPIFVKSFILDLMRYNDNRGNEFSDDHYISVLMSCLAQTLTTTRRTNASQELSLSIANEEADFMKKALDELGRHQRLDEWIPTFQNTYTTTALDCGQMLMLNRAIPAKPSEFLQYARAGNADHVRLKAWDCLVNLGMVRHDSIIKFIVHEICTDRSPYFRARLIRILEHGLGQVAVGDVFKLDKIKAPADGGLEIQQEDVLPNREDQVARRKLEGALRALKADLGGNTVLKESLEKALHSTITSARDVAELLEICTMIYPTKNSLVSVLKLPKYWKVQHLGNGQLRFFHSGRYRERLPKKPEVPVVAPPAPVVPLPPPQDAPAPPAPAPTKSLKIKLKPPAPGGFVAADGRTPTPSQESTRPNLVPPKPPTPREPQPPALPSPKPTLAAPLPPAKTTTPSAAQDRDRKSKPNLKVAPPPPPSRPEPPSRSRPPTPAGARPPSGSGSRPPTPTTQTQTQQRPNLKFSSSSRPSSRPGTPTGGPPSPAVPPAALAQGGGGGKIRLVNKKSGQSTSKMSQRAQQGQGQAPPSQPAALNRTAGATPAQSSGAGASKKSLIVKLRLAPEKLARVVRRQAQAQVSGSSSTGADARPEKGHGQKRKAKGENEEGKVRGLKRQASVPGEAGGAGESRNKGTGASAAAAGGAKPRKVVKLRIGRANAEVVRGRFGR